MLRSGVPAKEVARSFGVTKQWIYQLVKHYNIALPKRLRPVKVRATQEERFWRNVQRGQVDECWPWVRSCTVGGYGKHNRNGISVYAHRTAYSYANGPIPDGQFVCHHCDNPPCCNPSHLFAGTPLENIQDRDRKGRGTKGRPRFELRKYDEAVRADVIARRASGKTQRVIAAELNVSERAVRMICDFAIRDGRLPAPKPRAKRKQ